MNLFSKKICYQLLFNNVTEGVVNNKFQNRQLGLYLLINEEIPDLANFDGIC